MAKFIHCTFLAITLLFLVAVSSASPASSPVSVNEPVKRNNVCSSDHYKRNILGKRNYVKKCPCAFASASFEGKVSGFVFFAQDECGDTTLAGFFGKGFPDPKKNNYTFATTDDCGNITNDLGSLGIQFADDGSDGTKPFTKKFSTFNLNCDSKGLLLQKTAKDYGSCPKKYYYKRQNDGGSDLASYSNGASYTSASISGV